MRPDAHRFSFGRFPSTEARGSLRGDILQKWFRAKWSKGVRFRQLAAGYTYRRRSLTARVFVVSAKLCLVSSVHPTRANSCATGPEGRAPRNTSTKRTAPFWTNFQRRRSTPTPILEKTQEQHQGNCENGQVRLLEKSGSSAAMDSRRQIIEVTPKILLGGVAGVQANRIQVCTQAPKKGP